MQLVISDWELWACAQQVIKQHDDGATQFAFGRIADLIAAGDDQGRRTWLAIVDRIEQLQDRQGAGSARH